VRAHAIALALGVVARAGHDFLCRCPVHDGGCLSVADGRDGFLLLHCFAGCEPRDVWNELRGRGLIGGSSESRSSERVEGLRQAAAKAEAEKLRRRIAGACTVYGRGQAAGGTPVETYLRSRGITLPIPPVLGWLRHCPHRNGHCYPAMVAPIVDVHGEQIAVHKTFLRSDGSGKADLPKAEQRETCGPIKGGAVRLMPPRDGEILIAEGIETAIACMQLFGVPAWAALSANGIAALDLPADVRSVLIAADHDANGIGQRAALAARERRQGRAVRILLPPRVGQDFNDVLLEEKRNAQ
jgi:putative DNA primase/helicase